MTTFCVFKTPKVAYYIYSLDLVLIWDFLEIIPFPFIESHLMLLHSYMYYIICIGTMIYLVIFLLTDIYKQCYDKNPRIHTIL